MRLQIYGLHKLGAAHIAYIIVAFAELRVGVVALALVLNQAIERVKLVSAREREVADVFVHMSHPWQPVAPRQVALLFKKFGAQIVGAHVGE